MTKWSSVKEETYSKITFYLRDTVIKWLHNHPHIVSSPIYNDKLLFKDSSEPNTKTRVEKLLRQVSMRELHNDLLSDPPTGLSEVYDVSSRTIIIYTGFSSFITFLH